MASAVSVNAYPYSNNFNQNLVTIANFLEANGYTPNAAAGVAGTIYGESGGNPESVGSGGGGLIGWTPLGSAAPYPAVTGNPAVDFAHQLQDLLTYNANQGSAAMAALQSAGSPVAAADVYSAQFERPLVPYSDVHPTVVNAVAQAMAAGTTSVPAGGGRFVTSGGGGVSPTSGTGQLTSATSSGPGTGNIKLFNIPLLGGVSIPGGTVVRGTLLILGIFLTYAAVKGMFLDNGAGPTEVVSEGARSAAKDAKDTGEAAGAAAAA